MNKDTDRINILQIMFSEDGTVVRLDEDVYAVIDEESYKAEE